jgi:hypothetical protein
MLRLEKPARDPENTTLEAPASKNLCNVRVKLKKKVIDFAASRCIFGTVLFVMKSQ